MRTEKCGVQLRSDLPFREKMGVEEGSGVGRLMGEWGRRVCRARAEPGSCVEFIRVHGSGYSLGFSALSRFGTVSESFCDSNSPESARRDVRWEPS